MSRAKVEQTQKRLIFYHITTNSKCKPDQSQGHPWDLYRTLKIEGRRMESKPNSSSNGILKTDTKKLSLPWSRGSEQKLGKKRIDPRKPCPAKRRYKANHSNTSNKNQTVSVKLGSLSFHKCDTIVKTLVQPEYYFVKNRCTVQSKRAI